MTPLSRFTQSHSYYFPPQVMILFGWFIFAKRGGGLTSTHLYIDYTFLWVCKLTSRPPMSWWIWIHHYIAFKKKKGMVLYSAVSSPLDRSKRFTLSSPGRPVHSDTVLGFSWKHSSHAAIAQRLFTHISTTVYSQVLIYTAESTEASWSERKCPNF